MVRLQPFIDDLRSINVVMQTEEVEKNKLAMQLMDAVCRNNVERVKTLLFVDKANPLRLMDVKQHDVCIPIRFVEEQCAKKGGE